MFHFIAVQEQQLPTEGESPYQTDTPPPNAYVVGGSVVFHKYMYILYLLFKCGDKGRGGKGLVMLQKSTRQEDSHVGV